MSVSRRSFLHSAAAAAAAWPLAVRGWQLRDDDMSRGTFRHGVASGDPQADRVILWTRVTPAASASVDVRWHIASDDRLTQTVAGGTVRAVAERDFTVKVDAGGLRAGATYFYAFEAGGERSPIGRTRTLPAPGATRVRFGQVSCSNYPTGHFNVYRRLAERADLDAVLHLGDYMYEFPQGQYSNLSLGRTVVPPHETVTLEDYRLRYALYRSDPDLQEVHRQHPFIAVWDDHELANDAWSGGAGNHDPSEGDWKARQRAAYRAYLEWMPTREAVADDIQLYRHFAFGGLADLIMLDTRGVRDQQAPATDRAALADPRRTLLGAPQERWLADTLRDSQRAGTRWRIIGQQILFSPMTPPGVAVQRTDMWDGYPAARDRVFDVIDRDRVSDIAILTGDIHSSWAVEVARNPWGGSGASGSKAIEIVTPAVSSPPIFSSPALRDAIRMLLPLAPHVKFLEGDSRGYVLLDVTPERLQAEWYFVPTVTERAPGETRGARFICERGSSRLVPA